MIVVGVKGLQGTFFYRLGLTLCHLCYTQETWQGPAYTVRLTCIPLLTLQIWQVQTRIISDSAGEK